MVERTPVDGSLVDFALTRAPDLPRWVDTRGMLLSGRAEVFAPGGRRRRRPRAQSSSFAMRRSRRSPAARRPTPSRRVVASLSGDVNVLAQMEDADYVARALDGWRRRTAIIHVLPGPMPWEQEADPQARVFTRQNAPRFSHVPETLRRELLDALKGRTVARFVPGELPVVRQVRRGRDGADGGRLGGWTARLVLLSGVADGNAVGRLDRHPRAVPPPRSRRARGANADPAHARDGTRAGLGRAREQLGVESAGGAPRVPRSGRDCRLYRAVTGRAERAPT